MKQHIGWTLSYKGYVRSITWSCPRCGRPFTTQIERDLHWLQCGK